MSDDFTTVWNKWISKEASVGFITKSIFSYFCSGYLKMLMKCEINSFQFGWVPTYGGSILYKPHRGLEGRNEMWNSSVLNLAARNLNFISAWFSSVYAGLCSNFLCFVGSSWFMKLLYCIVYFYFWTRLKCTPAKRRKMKQKIVAKFVCL